jgi:hypothetical protein
MTGNNEGTILYTHYKQSHIDTLVTRNITRLSTDEFLSEYQHFRPLKNVLRGRRLTKDDEVDIKGVDSLPHNRTPIFWNEESVKIYLQGEG